METFKIELKRTRAKDGTKNVRLYINGEKTKYFAKGYGYDKDLDVFCQFIKDNFNDNNSQFKSIDFGMNYVEQFLISINAEFEKIKVDKNRELYFLQTEINYLKKGKK